MLAENVPCEFVEILARLRLHAFWTPKRLLIFVTPQSKLSNQCHFSFEERLKNWLSLPTAV
jgi:hypothetical protein